MRKFKVCMIAVMLTLILVSGIAVAQTRLRFWETKALSRIDLFVAGAQVPIYYGGPTYYITEQHSPEYLLYIDVKDNIQNKLIGLDGKVYEVKFSSSVPDVASINDYGIIRFSAEGYVVFTVSVDDFSLEIPVQVVEGPFVIKFLDNKLTTEDLVKELGFPQNRTSTTVRWPDRTAVLHNILYTFSGTNTIDVEHWHYDKYPTLLFRISDNIRLNAIQNAGWDCGYSSKIRYDLGLLGL